MAKALLGSIGLGLCCSLLETTFGESPWARGRVCAALVKVYVQEHPLATLAFPYAPLESC